MKLTYYFLVAPALLILLQCKTTRSLPKATPAPAPVTISSRGSDASIPTQLQAAEKRWPGTHESELDAGKMIYTEKCTQCHKAYKIEEFGERKWLHEIDDMSPKAKLTAEEKQKLTKYILSYMDLKAMVKGN